MIGTQQKRFADQKHAKVFHCSDDCIHFEFVGAVVAFRTAERSAEEPDWMFKSSVCEYLI
jgi:hypothetical protein